MKFAAIALLAATVSANRLIPGVHYIKDFMGSEDKPKTYLWEKDLEKKTNHKGPKTQEEIDAEWDGDLGFDINMGGMKFNTKMTYDNNDKFQVQSILDYYSDHDLKEPWKGPDAAL